MKTRSVLILMLIAASATSVAYAERVYYTEVGYFAEDGVSMNGSVIYPCEGPRIVNGDLVGEQRIIFQERCACLNDDCNEWPTDNPPPPPSDP